MAASMIVEGNRAALGRNHLQVVHRPFHWQANKEEDIMYNKLINRLVTDYFIYAMGVLCHA